MLNPIKGSRFLHYSLTSPATPHQSTKGKLNRSTDYIKSKACRVPNMTPVQSHKRTSAEARRDSGAGLMTPSKTPSSPDKSTMRLKLEIPQRDISKEEERKLKIRKAAAKRWAPNLQRPPPQLKEINAAYKNKLMRHYTDGTAAPSDNILRPPINRSARVDALLATLPLQPEQKLPKPLSQIQAEHCEQVRVAALLESNRKITESAYAKELAKEAFSSNGKPRDRKSLKRKFAESTGQDGV